MSLGIGGGSPDWDPMAAISQFEDQKISKTQSDIASLKGSNNSGASGNVVKAFSADSFAPAEMMQVGNGFSTGAQNVSNNTPNKTENESTLNKLDTVAWVGCIKYASYLPPANEAV